MATASATARCPAPTIRKAAYFTRGSGHNEKAQYTEREDDYVNNMDRLAHKFETMRQHRSGAGGHDQPEGRRSASSPPALRDYAVRESCDQFRDEYEIEASYLRLQAYPFTAELLDFIRRHERVYVVDQNRDAQLLALMRLELDPGADRQTAQRALLRRAAARCAHRYR